MRVYQAEAYRYGAMGSTGDAANMLISQHQFPDVFNGTLDMMLGTDHDRIMEQQNEHGNRCFKEHTGGGELSFEDWIRRAEPAMVIAFLQDILKAEPSIKWTGFRVLGSVHRGNGYPVWSLALFAKSPDSTTQVYNMRDAPNLISGSRHSRR